METQSKNEIFELAGDFVDSINNKDNKSAIHFFNKLCEVGCRIKFTTQDTQKNQELTQKEQDLYNQLFQIYGKEFNQNFLQELVKKFDDLDGCLNWIEENQKK